jgi:hypothetical protein
VITAVGRVDDNGSRHLVGDVFGNVHVIVLSPDASKSRITLHRVVEPHCHMIPHVHVN